jgi:xanthine dioxygenase
VKAFDPASKEYAHGDYTKTKSLLNSYLNQIPRVPTVQVIGHGKVFNHEGIPELNLKHAHHSSFHKTRVSVEDEALGTTRFYRWHMDAALYAKAPAKVTALYALRVPEGPSQTVRYDDGTGDTLEVPLGTTAFASGQTMFEILPKEYKNLAVRARARYAPHPFEWMKTARANPLGVGLETEGLEMPLDQLSPWVESEVKTYPFASLFDLYTFILIS